jgi:hypothetical protein
MVYKKIGKRNMCTLEERKKKKEAGKIACASNLK